MNLSKVFIDRPIFAGVLSVFVFLIGLVAMFQLPISEYPEVTPPSIVVNASFPGANPKVIAETVAAPLEEQINGVENMLYMNSQSTSDGRLTLTITFAIGTDPDLAQQQVQNRVSQALPRLPAVTRNLGVTTVKSSPDLTMVVHLTSPDGRYDSLYLRNYAVLNVRDELARITGIGQVQLFGGGDYAMRLWLNPEKIAERGLTAGEVIAAVREQNVQVAAGVIGGAPYDNPGAHQLPINTQGRLSSPEEFRELIIRTDDQGRITRLADVAEVEMGASDYALRSLLNNRNAAALPIFAAPGANALDISENVRATMAELKTNFPEGLEYEVVYDPTVFVRDSIKSVVRVLFEALILVVLVVMVFLQRWRAAVIPLMAVPVSIVGTFAFMYLFGFSINVLSLFGLILAIGIVVDDAIIVVENVERNIADGLNPRDATIKAMREVTGPVIATTLVLIAVFVPIAFISGLTGQFYRQFALTIAISTVISSFNSLTLSPALSRLLLKPEGQEKDWLSRTIQFLFGWFFRLFDRFFKRNADRYANSIGGVLRHRGLSMAAYVLLLGGTYFAFQSVPSGFIPVQDKQYLVAFAQLPEGSNLDRTEAVIREMSQIALETEGVADSVAFPGLSINGFTNSSSAGIVFVALEDFESRDRPDLGGLALTGQLQAKFNGIEEAFIAIFPPPPVQGLGTIGGFKLQIEDRTDQGDAALARALHEVIGRAYQTPELAGVFSSYQINVPQLFADLDRTKAKQLGLNINDIFETMQVYLGSLYINDFNKFGRTYRVIAQAEDSYRDQPQDILNLKVRNNRGEMIPLAAVMKVEETFGPEAAARYNGFRAADINGNAAPGFSSGQAQAAITRILDETLPPGMQYEWTELTYQQILAGDSTLMVMGLVVLFVFLVLAAQYESLTLPLSIILIVPMSMLSALVGIKLTGGDNNIFTQISLFVLMGLATKNAILIVEFARELESQGMAIVAAAIEACRLRLRPILMTSFSFIMGVFPLAISTGAGSEMRNAMGIAVFSGMLGVTFFGLFLTPVFYVILRKLETRGAATTPDQPTPTPVVPDTAEVVS
ncbi:efflux RND transporter permease subunit [Acanthopleuribacter pedis]|uniref:Efflux RND transporter permease subunit n=1 Tax=Acanthopleuribacter pedis TaxID=442870 RepID=A0A8J7QCL9_9BACT|nr:efflux RND transporter permease subunit [Acanthopleuribacter pedis]MBO1321304.1 efflux RND transporter permease subunit [Acanthopleuribacter pedis]